MINSIEIKNFQSHKNSFLELSSGVNVIIGSSDSGKTAILRALNWCIYNRPQGLAYISYWNRDKKKQPIEDTSIEINTGDQIIKRFRNNENNGYDFYVSYIDKEKQHDILEAIGTDVPEQVTKLFNISEVNIQRQMDAPFLLSESAPEVARFFNREIRLDIIDRVLSNAETQRRRINQESTKNELDIEDISSQINNLSWIDAADDLAKKIERRQERIDEKKESSGKLEVLLNSLRTQLQAIAFLDKVIPAEEISVKIVALIDNMSEKKKDANKVYQKIESYFENKKISDSIQDFSKAIKLMEEIEDFDVSIDDKADSIDTLSNRIKVYMDAQSDKLAQIKTIESGEKQLPKLCPLCNKPLDGKDIC